MVFKEIQKLMAAMNATNLLQESLKMRTPKENGNVTMVVTEKPNCPHWRSFHNLNGISGKKDRKLSPKRWRRVRRAVENKIEEDVVSPEREDSIRRILTGNHISELKKKLF